MINSVDKNEIINTFDRLAVRRGKWIKKNSYYYSELVRFLKYNIPSGSSVLEIGCGTGYLLNSLKPRRGVGVDISPQMDPIS